MAATVASSVYANPGTASSITFAGLAVSAGQTVVVYLDSRDGSGGANYSSATWNGVAETADESQNGTLADGIQFHRIVFRGITGTHSLVITLSATMDDLAGRALVIDGADQTTTIGDVDTTNLTATSDFDSGGVTLTTVSGDLVLTAIRVRADVTASIAEDAGQTLIGSDQLTSNGNTSSLSSEGAVGASTTVGWTWDGSGFPTWALDAMVITAAAGGGGGLLPRLTLMGVG